MYADDVLLEFPGLLALPEDCVLVDCHTHVGARDPSGFSASLEDLTSSLDLVGARAVVFPLKDPEGYSGPNRQVLEWAEEDERLVAFCRLDPADGALAELEQCLALGARGVKLHPRGEGFAVSDERLADVWALADERRLPVLVHAGEGLDGLGDEAVAIAERHPGARLILAHCGISDLGWIWQEARRLPNLLFDASWWNVSDIMALMCLVPPGQVLFGSDLPWSSPLNAALVTARCARQAGHGDDVLRSILGGQVTRLLDGDDPLDLGPAPGAEEDTLDPLLQRLHTALAGTVEGLQRNEEAGQNLELARAGCRVPEDHPVAPLTAALAELLTRATEVHEQGLGRSNGNPFAAGRDLVLAASAVARTPRAGV